jgi:hypothetical protein
VKILHRPPVLRILVGIISASCLASCGLKADQCKINRKALPALAEVAQKNAGSWLPYDNVGHAEKKYIPRYLKTNCCNIYKTKNNRWYVNLFVSPEYQVEQVFISKSSLAMIDERKYYGSPIKTVEATVNSCGRFLEELASTDSI